MQTHHARRDAHRRAAAMRVQTWASMTTEYQDKFLPPYYYKAVISTTTQKKRYHPLKGTSNDISDYRSTYVTHRWIKHPKAQLPSTLPRVHQSCSRAPDNPASESTGYTSVYKKDFQAWNINKLQEMGSCRKDPAQPEPVTHKKHRPPVESITSYRSDYVAHPLPPRTNRKPVDQSNKAPRLDPAPSTSKQVAGHGALEAPDGANQLFQHFHNCSIKCEFHSRGREPAEATILSTTHAHYTAHQCQRTEPKPVGKSGQPFHTTTTREGYGSRPANLGVRTSRAAPRTHWDRGGPQGDNRQEPVQTQQTAGSQR